MIFLSLHTATFFEKRVKFANNVVQVHERQTDGMFFQLIHGTAKRVAIVYTAPPDGLMRPDLSEFDGN